MKKISILPLFLLFLFMASLVFAEPLKKATGADWLLMSAGEKKDYIQSAMDFLQKRGVPLSKPPGYYGSAINNLTDKPGAEKAEVINLLTSFVYQTEPYTRKAIDQFKKKKPSPQASPKKT